MSDIDIMRNNSGDNARYDFVATRYNATAKKKPKIAMALTIVLDFE